MEKLDFYAALVAIQASLRATKDQFNQYGGYKYRSAESILAAVKPLLEKAGLVINLTDTIAQIGDRFYLHATARITDGINCESSDAWAREPLQKKGMDESQVTGSASSYARKYALCGLLGIDDSSADPDNPANHPDNPETAKRDAKIKAAAQRGIDAKAADKAKAEAKAAKDAKDAKPKSEAEIKADVAKCADMEALNNYFLANQNALEGHIGILSERKKELLKAIEKAVAKCATVEELAALKSQTKGVNLPDVRNLFTAREDAIKSAAELAAVL